MNVYYVHKFESVIVAENRLTAFGYLADELKRKRKFTLDFRDINKTEFIQLDTNFAHAILLKRQEKD